MIYAIGLDSDRTFRHLISEAFKRGIEVQAINLRAVVAGDWRIALPDDGQSWIAVPGWRFELDPQASYFCRIMDLASVQDEQSLALQWRSLVVALTSWLDSIPGTVVNRSSARSDNASKALHEYALQCSGFNVPSSLTSSDPEQLIAFASAGPTIVKAISGVRANSRLIEVQELKNFRSSQGPIHLQKYVAGKDVRAHVVGNYVHVELIESTEVDYRHTPEQVKTLSHYELPRSVEEQIVKATAAFGLTFAGWDFKVADDGTYWCLEANPMPGYDGYDRRAGGSITASLLQVLLTPETPLARQVVI